MSGSDGRAALHLLAWLSPAFPVGAFAYSHGLEAAADSGDVRDAASLERWIVDLVEHGSIRNDLVLLAAAWRAATAGNATTLAEVNDLALALGTSRERLLETGTMGTSFASAIRSAWPSAASAVLPDGEVAYPISFAASCAASGIALQPSLECYGLSFVQNLVSAAIRLGCIGQTDGQRVTAALIDPALRLAAEAADTTLDDLGGSALRSDIAAMRHEILYSRLFRS